MTESRTVILQSVVNEIKEHGRSSMHEEVCGVLVGSLCWDGAPYLLIDARIEGKYASHQSGSVTFTSDTWDFIHEELAGKHPDRIIVGWYHTHPGFGIFLSNMDAFIHENFFSFPWQPAYVFDPQGETDGFFFRTGGELRQEEVSIAPDAAPAVKEPMLPPPDSVDRIVIDDGKSRLWPVVAFAVSLVLCLGALAFVLFSRLREKEEAGHVAETQIESLREDVEKREEEIRRHRTDEAEWIVKQKTYEKEIAGLHLRITEITAERGHLAATNKTQQAELLRVQEELAKLKSALDENARKLSEINSDKEEAEAGLSKAREEIGKLQARLSQLEKAAENPCPVSPEPIHAENVTSSYPKAESHPWWWHLHPFK